MNLTHEQIRSIEQGEPVPVTVDGTRCVIVREDVYDRMNGALDADTVYDLMEATMAEDDANDPGLESYQKYK